MKFRPLLCSLVPSLLLANVGVAQTYQTPLETEEHPAQAGYLTFYLDNDLFAGKDKDYTNGARISWISSDRTVRELGRIQQVLRRFSGDEESFEPFQRVTGFDEPSKVRYNYGFSLTQLMYTPADAEPYTQPEGQRRYAGWAGLGFSLHIKDDSVLNSVEFTIGTTGPNAQAETTQDFIHSIQGSQKFNGWDEQIPNEITGDISFVQKRRSAFLTHGSGNFTMDGLSEWGVRLGTFRTSAHIGGMFRLGYNLPSDFSDARLSDTAYSHRYFGKDEDYSGNWSVYTLFGVMGRVVGYDATLDGPMFQSFETGNSREPFVGEAFAGIGVRYKAVEWSYVQTWRSQEYKEQNGSTDFGSIALRVRF
ncbi:MAG: lipid A deacylase LpxR family protein [Luteolibacter sp.]